MKDFTILWLQSGGCGGCSMSTINAENPDFLTSLALNQIDLLWHPSLSEAGDRDFLQLLQQIEEGSLKLDVLCLEGSVIMGPRGTGSFHRLSGSNRAMFEVINSIANKASYVVAIGSCASFGGITMSGNNPSEATGLQYHGMEQGGLLSSSWKSLANFPVVNIAGCPTHPSWVIESLLMLKNQQLAIEHLDSFQRPRSYTDHLVHHGCPRNEFYEYKASALKATDQGCLMENKGCLGTQARADCNIRLWNGEGSCLRGGYACINCTAPRFEEPGHSFTQTPKIAGIPVGLPVDMPKAWFVALSSLAKAATPARLKVNALSEHLKISPGGHQEKGK